MSRQTSYRPYGIVAAHGGTFALESTVEAGTIARVSLLSTSDAAGCYG